MIRTIDFKIAPEVALWRVQCVVALIVLVLLVLLPITVLARIVLCGSLILSCLGLRYRSAKYQVKSLYIDVSNWKLGLIDRDQKLQSIQANIGAEYFGAWLVVLKYDFDDHHYRLPVFRFMTSSKDFSRLLAFVRSGAGR